MAIKVGINGFGRIGRNVFRAGAHDSGIDFVAVNDITDAKTLGYLLEYDSVHGKFNGSVEAGDNALTINGKELKVLAERDPGNLPWKDLGVDVVIESTGLFRKKEQASKHISAGAKKVLISAPSPDADLMVVMGVNDDEYDNAKHNILSNASCTTNCLGPVIKVIHSNFTIEHGLMTTIHSYTNDQRILDLPHKDLRRARAAALSMIPTTTGAAKAIGLVVPELKGKLDGLSIRVPTPNVSIVDVVLRVKTAVDKDIVNDRLKEASESSLKGILEYSDKPLVSKDFNGNPASSIVDGPSTYVVEGHLVKVLSWYDNEWGYSNRMLDLVKHIAKSL